jgi:O-acetyl-ADP-ribose deacetylase
MPLQTEHPIIKLVQGDITQQSVDAIVNAANESLLGGGGVDGAIHRAAGPELLEECRRLNGCKTGNAKITKGYRLIAKWVIHTVGPRWKGGGLSEPELLRSCYQTCLELAHDRGIRTLAFPSISTGAYGYPIEAATRIAIGTILEFLKKEPCFETVVLVCFNQEALQLHERLLQEMLSSK